MGLARVVNVASFFGEKKKLMSDDVRVRVLLALPFFLPKREIYLEPFFFFVVSII